MRATASREARVPLRVFDAAGPDGAFLAAPDLPRQAGLPEAVGIGDGFLPGLPGLMLRAPRRRAGARLALRCWRGLGGLGTLGPGLRLVFGQVALLVLLPRTAVAGVVTSQVGSHVEASV